MNVSPTLKEYARCAKGKNLIVFSCKFYCDYLTPLSIYHRIRKPKHESFLLESVEGQEKISRFSFIGFDPIASFKTNKNTFSVRLGGKKVHRALSNDPLGELKKLMSGFSVWPKENIRFFGGFVGYLGYDMVRFYEPVGREIRDCVGADDTHLILPKFLIIFDHRTRQIEVLSFVYCKNRKHSKSLYQSQVRALKKVVEKIIVPVRLSPLDISAHPKKGKVQSNFKKESFLKAVKKAKQYIKEGEIIQVVLSQRLSLQFKKDSFLAYRYLRLLNPSPYMFYLEFNQTKIAGSSPEMLVRCEKDELITRPIAGTRRRGHTEEDDLFMEKELLSDIKEKAEHVMLVDLGRNDLGRVAQKGSVHVPLFMSIERFSHVMHIVSEVRGKLSRKKDIFDALCACFPAGTVTGAPKVRAMQIINELEPQRRGIYAGSIGYFSFTNSLDTCIIIRTVVFKGSKAYIQAGAGIVADSKPYLEYKETLNKARAQLIALELAGAHK